MIPPAAVATGAAGFCWLEHVARENGHLRDDERDPGPRPPAQFAREKPQVVARPRGGQLLDIMVRPSKPKQPERPLRDRWDRLFDEQKPVNWKVL